MEQSKMFGFIVQFTLYTLPGLNVGFIIIKVDVGYILGCFSTFLLLQTMQNICPQFVLQFQKNFCVLYSKENVNFRDEWSSLNNIISWLHVFMSFEIFELCIYQNHFVKIYQNHLYL